MKFVTYNIQYSKGKDDQYDIDRIADEVAGADVIALQEVERFWPRSGNIDQVKALTRRLSEYHWVYGAGVDLNADKVSAKGIVKHQRRQFGNMLLTRSPIIYFRHHLLPKYGSVGPLSVQRSAIEGAVNVGDSDNEQAVRLYSVHLTHLSAETRLPQVQCLLDIHSQTGRDGAPISGDLTGMDWASGVEEQTVPDNAIIMGDFNFMPDAKEYDLMVGPLSDYGGRISNPKGFVDAWTACGNDEQSGTTSDVDGEPARLDYCYVSTALKDSIKTCYVDESAHGSDHQPVWIEFDF